MICSGIVTKYKSSFVYLKTVLNVSVMTVCVSVCAGRSAGRDAGAAAGGGPAAAGAAGVLLTRPARRPACPPQPLLPHGQDVLRTGRHPHRDTAHEVRPGTSALVGCCFYFVCLFVLKCES